MSLADLSAPGGARDPRPALLSAPMSAGQWLAVGVTLLVSATDGYDILAASLAAPSITKVWGLTHERLGLILAVNLVGLALGAVVISPLADRVGRRLTILGSLVLVTASMFLSAAADGPLALGAARLVAGLGIGGMVGATLSLATEYANGRNRPLSAAVISLGLPLGGLIVGAVATVLLRTHTWRSVFVSGGIVTAAVTLLAAVSLPESVDYLLGRRHARHLPALNGVLRRFGQPVLAELPPMTPGDSGEAAGARPRGTSVFGRGLWATTLAMVLINFTQMMQIFFFVSWLPQIVADLRYAPAVAASVSIAQNALGIVGALLVGWLARRLPIVPLSLLTMVGTSLAIMLFAYLPHDIGRLRAEAAFEGLMALGCSAGIYGVMAQAFPAASRSTGTGFAYAFGRIGSILAAVVPGALFTHGWSLASGSWLMVGVSVLGFVTLLAWNTAVGLPSRAAAPATAAPVAA